MKSVELRNDYLFLRSGLISDNKWGMPLIKRQGISSENLELIAYSATKNNDIENHNKVVHFFVDDARFNVVYNNPSRSIAKLSQYRAVLSPDFSLYGEMEPWRMMESIAKNRWCGAFWQNCGMTVIPTISWSTKRSYDFCFLGVEENSIVAISTVGCQSNKKEFLDGYNEMMKRLRPSLVICYGNPIAGMTGNVIYIKYKVEIRRNNGR